MNRARRPPTRTVAAAVVVLSTAVGGCVTTAGSRGEPLVPSRYLTQAGPYRIWTNEPLEPDAAAPTELFDLHRQLESQLGIRVDPSEAPIDIYILSSRSSFEHLLRFYYPELPPRRAFFLARGERRTVFAHRGPHLVEDLRHEATHALLHAAASDLPLWLDEGLAEYFEVPAERQGAHSEHVALLRGDVRGGWGPDLARLEAIRDVRQMTARDYREAWAWSHYLLRGSRQGRTELLGYLADLRSGIDTPPLSKRLGDGASNPRLIAHVEQVVEPSNLITPTSGSTIVLRGQNVSTDDPAARPVPRRRGLLGRLAGLLGL